jgi:hypothetical protein
MTSVKEALAMADARKVSRLLNELHQQKIVNRDVSIRSI